MKKDFEGQYKNEKLLLIRKENFLHFLFFKKYHFLIFFVILFIINIVFYLGKLDIIYSILINFIIIGFYFWHNKVMYDNTLIIITTRRIIKKVKNGFFRSHEKELLLGDIRQITTTKTNFIETIFNCGNIKVLGAEEKGSIYFKGITNNKDIGNYITRILDYIKLNGHTDNISKYVPKKERKKNN